MNILVTAALAFFFAVGLGLAAAGGIRAAWRGLGRRRGVSAALAAFAVIATICAQKPGPSGPTITIDALLRDAGCYATNDVFHAAVSNAPAYAAIDFSACAVLVYARERGQTNAVDWAELTPRRTYGELPADYAIANATNYNYLVYLDYVPPSPVHTNGVFELHGFLVPQLDTQLAAGFINSRAVTIRDLPYDAEVEYLESTGTQWIDTGVDSSIITHYATDCEMLAVGAEGSNISPYLFIGIQSMYKFYGYIGQSSATTVNADNLRHVFELKNTGVASVDGFYLDGVRIKERGTGIVASAPFYLFACYQFPPLRYFLKQRKYSCKIYSNDTLVRDFISVRIGTTGAMYDKRGVGGMNPDGTARNDGLYFNRGTGNFGYGNDK